VRSGPTAPVRPPITPLPWKRERPRAHRPARSGAAARRRQGAARGCGSTDPSRRPAAHLVGPAGRGRSSRRIRPAKPNSPSRPSHPQSVWSRRWSSRGAAGTAGASVAWADAGPASARVRPRPRRLAATRWGDRRYLIVLPLFWGHGGEPYSTVGTPRRGQPARPHPAPGPSPDSGVQLRGRSRGAGAGGLIGPGRSRPRSGTSPPRRERRRATAPASCRRPAFRPGPSPTAATRTRRSGAARRTRPGNAPRARRTTS